MENWTLLLRRSMVLVRSRADCQTSRKKWVARVYRVVYDWGGSNGIEEWMECFQESRTRAPSRLSRMWTALLARLGEISIVLHAGDARCERQADELEGQLRQTTTAQ